MSDSNDAAPSAELVIPDIPNGGNERGKAPEWASPEAKQEEKNWDSLDEVRRENDKMWLRLYGKVLLVVTVVFTAVFIAALLVWTWHYMAPSGGQWLDDKQLSKIQSVLFSGGMGAVVSNIIRNQMGKA